MHARQRQTVSGRHGERSNPLRHKESNGLICLARNDEMASSGATNWHDGQITKSLSSPFCKNIPLNFESKSSA
jgi:hypothetical protein